MQKGASEKIFSLEAYFMAVFEQSFNLNFLGSTDKAVDFRNGQATFVVFDDFAVGFDYFGIDEGGKSVIILVAKVVAYDDDTAIDAKLGGGHGGG